MGNDEIKTVDGYWHIPENFRKITWMEYESTINVMISKIQDYLEQNNQVVDVIVPILRGGLVPSNYLAYRLKLLKVVPVQYKYLCDGEEDFLKRILPFNADGLLENSTILLVDNNHGTGLQAETAAAEIKELLPKSTILYATTYMDFSNQKNENADVIFYGELSNSTVALTPNECEELGIEFKVPLSPWEMIEEEAYMGKDSIFEYINEKDIVKNSETVKEFSL